MVWVLGDINRFAVILYFEDSIHIRHVNVLHGIGRLLLTQTNHLVMRIHQKFVHQLVEPRVHRNLAGLEGAIGSRKPHLLLCRFNRPNVGVWQGEDVLTVSLLAILV